MLGGEFYSVRAKSGPLPLREIENRLRVDPLVAPAPIRDRVWFTVGDKSEISDRIKYSIKSGRLPTGGVLIFMFDEHLALDIVSSDAASRVPLVRFLEWLQARCDLVITEDGFGTPAELERVGVRAFLPEELRDKVDALYDEAVRREPPPTIEDEADDQDPESELN